VAGSHLMRLGGGTAATHAASRQQCWQSVFSPH